MARVIIVHQHEESEGGTILGVFNDDDIGKRLAAAMEGGTGCNVTEAQVLDVYEPPTIDPIERAALLAVRRGGGFTEPEFATLGGLIARGVLDRRAAPGGGIVIELTPIGEALLSIAAD